MPDGHEDRKATLRIVVREAASPDPVPLSERLSRALLPAVLRLRLGALAPRPGRSAERARASRDTLPPPHV
jgi:hypothetical protein